MNITFKEVQQEILNQTDLREDELTVPKLKKVSEDLALAWNMAKKHKDSSLFVNQYNKWREKQKWSNSRLSLMNKKRQENVERVEKHLKKIKSTSVENGFIISGFYHGVEHRVFSRKKSVGKRKLVEHILSQNVSTNRINEKNVDVFINKLLFTDVPESNSVKDYCGEELDDILEEFGY